MFLQRFDKGAQIHQQLVFKHKKLLRLHHFFRMGAVERPDIILIIAVEADKILIQSGPGFRGFLITFFNQRRQREDLPVNPFNQAGLQRSTFDFQTFQTQSQPFDFHGIFA